MINLYDIAYGVGVGLASPYWLIRPSARRKVSRAFRERMGRDLPNIPAGPVIMIHAVSLGEINATRALVDELLKRRGDLHIVISTTTETGHERGKQLYGKSLNVSLIWYPLDFTGAIERALAALRPRVVVLMELELWPNFVRACDERGIAVLLANGRLTASSFARYRVIKPVMAKMLSRVRKLCVQDELYAQRFRTLGANDSQIRVIGTMKFDNAAVADRVDGDSQLAADVGLNQRDERVLVCGSTGPGEEVLLLRVYRELLTEVDSKLRLVIVPRHPQRFDEVAALIRGQGFDLARRSEKRAGGPGAVILGDTMGELRKFYSVADVVFVGRSLVDLGSRQHGSDMIEPAALAKPVIVGKFTGNFAEAVRRFLANHAIIEVRDRAGLSDAIAQLLNDPAELMAMGHRAQEVVRREQGATQRHADEIMQLLPTTQSAI